MVLQQAEPAEMDRLGEAAEKAAGQVWTGANCLLWSRVLHTQCRPAATGDHEVMCRQSHVLSSGVLVENMSIEANSNWTFVSRSDNHAVVLSGMHRGINFLCNYAVTM